MAGKQLEIVCSVCGADTLVVRTPKYDGFTRVGETLKCASCGHEYTAESEVPFKHRKQVSVFDASDASSKVVVFREDEKGRLCRYCRNYIVNPFVQRCGLRQKFVEATDTCADFAEKPAPQAPPAEPPKPVL